MRSTLLAASGAAVVLLSAGGVRADCADAVVAAFEAMRMAGPYRSSMVTQGPAGFVHTETIAAWPAGMRTSTRGGDTTSDLVVLGDRVWQDEGEGQGFVEVPAERAKPIAAAARANAARPLTRPDKATCVGEEEKDGSKHAVYEYERPFRVADRDGSSHARLSVDLESKLPRRMVVTSTAMGIVSLSHVTITYDAAIRIEIPTTPAASAPATVPPVPGPPVSAPSVPSVTAPSPSEPADKK